VTTLWIESAGKVCRMRLTARLSSTSREATRSWYDQGRTKWQSETLDFVRFDEEPPQEVYIEGLRRTNATGGMVYLTFTPLKGISDVVHSFITECDEL
jgi:phage terminase large subunit-like protein